MQTTGLHFHFKLVLRLTQKPLQRSVKVFPLSVQLIRTQTYRYEIEADTTNPSRTLSLLSERWHRLL